MKHSLKEALAMAREKKAEKHTATKAITTPRAPEPPKPPEMEIITNPQRLLAQKCTEQAMICGWDKAIQKTAYENDVSEQTMREILDDALEYEDKADPAGRIEGLEDWRHEKRGSSELASPRH